MVQDTVTSCIFSSYLKISYDKRFLCTAMDAMKSLAELCGANEKECFQITKMAEESLVFIIDKYLDNGLRDHIEISFMFLSDNTVMLEFSDMGMPIHEDKIPELNIEQEDTLSGHWYHMIQKISDSVEIINQLNNGWLIRVSKNLEMGHFTNASDTDLEKRESGTPQARMAVPEDAPALIDLAYMTYRYTNAFPESYDVVRLKKYIKDGQYDVFITEINGKIVGSFSMKYSTDGSKSAELSGAMIHPSYRNSKVFIVYIIEVSKYHKDNPKNIDFFVSYAVTTHIKSQKGLERVNNGYKPMAIPLNMLPSPNFIGIKDLSGERETQVNYYYLNKPFELSKIFVPKPHAEIIKELIENTETSLEICTETAGVWGDTQIKTVEYLSALSVVLHIENVGKDWYSTIVKSVIKELSTGYRSILINLPTNIPLPIEVNDKLAELNFIFCGLTLSSLKEVRLTYVFCSDSVDFSKIKIFNPVAKKLFQHIQEQYQAIYK